jgi:large subunit ribosomal protein L17
MRHKIKSRTFGRTAAPRKALFRNLTNSLIKYGKIETTLPKAKELRSYADRIVTIVKII